ncbi:hypothetical protein QQS21_007335 [Conoideocrella luteorostrata]|uniref:WW domain-containing protein n=1 Tax=Conoideocrella luteorostrata TaxID=1105319 RepID=A0AAJ0CLQ2_9HYPO|nr:hypothetical protein QQS21_007335 [Conoideocrella luteorostrata]
MAPPPASPERVAAEEPTSKSPEAAAQTQDAPQPEPAQDAPSQHDQSSSAPSPAGNSESEGKEEGEIDSKDEMQSSELPPLPLPSETVPGGPPLPNEPVPQSDDGWDCQWDHNTQAWFFHNRFTGKTQWDNPRATATTTTAAAAASSSADPHAAAPPPNEAVMTGYNPAIHGDYDPNAWYAQKYKQDDLPPPVAPEIPGMDDETYAVSAGFNRFTGQYQQADAGPGRFSDESKSQRQMNAYFDLDAVASTDDGRSLKAERSNKRISKSELKAFKEKRRARKEEKRRAWLRD